MVPLEQNGEQPLRRNQAGKPAIRVDDGQTGFTVLDGNQRGVFLVGARSHNRRIRVHHLLHRRVGGCGQQLFNGGDADEPPGAADGDDGGTVELAAPHLREYHVDRVAGGGRGYDCHGVRSGRTCLKLEPASFVL